MHGRDAGSALPGVRCALNLQGVPLAELSRGAVVTQPGAVPVTGSFDASLRWLPGAPPLEEKAAVEVLTGTAERRAHVAPIGAPALAPGASGYARFHLEGTPLPLLPGDRFIVRGFARTDTGGATLGGGVVLDIAPPHRRRSDPALLRDLEVLARRDPEQDLRVRIERAGYAGCEAGALRRETGLRGEAFAPALGAALAASGALRTRDGRCVSSAALAALEAQLLAALEAYHAREPLRPGMPAGALRGRLPENVPADVAALALATLAERGEIVSEADHVRLRSHRVELDAHTQQLAERLCAVLAAAGLEAPALRDLAAQVGAKPEPLGDVLAHLEREGRLVRAPGDLWFDASAVEALRERLRGHFRTHDTLDTPTYKALIGTTRRTAVPLMELLDTERFTTRRGEVRILRGT
jgi:selenocysteine-specific elongation factor